MPKSLLAAPPHLPEQTTVLILATSQLPPLRLKSLLAIRPRQLAQTVGLILGMCSLLLLSPERH